MEGGVMEREKRKERYWPTMGHLGSILLALAPRAGGYTATWQSAPRTLPSQRASRTEADLIMLQVLY